MRIHLTSAIFVVSYCFNLHHVQAIFPTQCPKIDATILKEKQAEFSKKNGAGHELALDGYGWKIVKAQNLDQSLSVPSNEPPFVYSATRPGVTVQSQQNAAKKVFLCLYDFKLNNQPVAHLTLRTEHQYKLWREVPKDAEKALEKEEEQLPQHFRIQME